MVVVWSATKGLAAMTLALAHSRGWLDYEERVCTYWPEFAQQGKETITVRQLLAHQAGLFAFDEPVDRDVIADLDRLAIVLARQKPAWPPGTRQAYHAISLGFYEGELLRRVDPMHRSLGEFFQDEIASPLGMDFYIRLPEGIPNSRLATLVSPTFFELLLGLPIRLTLATLYPRSNIYKALIRNPGSALTLDKQRIYARNFEVPAGGGVGTARSIARAYSVFATGGRELQLRRETLQALTAPPVPRCIWILRRVHERRGAVFAWFLQAEPHSAIRSPWVVRSAGGGRLHGVRRFANRSRIRLCHQPNGHDIDRGSARPGA